MDPPLAFDAARARMADHIARGGLSGPASAAAVQGSSWGSLASMNRLGLLTYDSQDAPRATERAYVCGFVRASRAREFVERVNLAREGVVAYTVPQVGAGSLSGHVPIAVTRRGGRGTSHLWTGLTAEAARVERHDAGLRRARPGEAGEVLVHCFDPVWGRPAGAALFEVVLRALRASASASGSSQRI